MVGFIAQGLDHWPGKIDITRKRNVISWNLLYHEEEDYNFNNHSNDFDPVDLILTTLYKMVFKYCNFM